MRELIKALKVLERRYREEDSATADTSDGTIYVDADIIQEVRELLEGLPSPTLEYQWKYKNYELRACNLHLMAGDAEKPNCTIELIKWQGLTCFTIAHWRKLPNEDIHELHFTGDRFFQHVSLEDVFTVMSQCYDAQAVLDKWDQEVANE